MAMNHLSRFVIYQLTLKLHELFLTREISYDEYTEALDEIRGLER